MGDLDLLDADDTSNNVDRGCVEIACAKVDLDALDEPVDTFHPQSAACSSSRTFTENADKLSWMCSTHGCEKPSWNRCRGEYCSSACRGGLQQAMSSIAADGNTS